MPALLPLGEQDRLDLTRWSRTYDLLDGVWFSSGPLGFEAYEATADPAGDLVREARGHAALIEAATNVPTYAHVRRDIGYPDEARRRRCPICRGPWRTATDREENSDFAFRCDLCRLTSGPPVRTAEIDAEFSAAAVGWAGPDMPAAAGRAGA